MALSRFHALDVAQVQKSCTKIIFFFVYCRFKQLKRYKSANKKKQRFFFSKSNLSTICHKKNLTGRWLTQLVKLMHDRQCLEEAWRVEDPTSLENTMQVGRRPTQLGAWQIALKVPRRGTSCQPLIIPLNPRQFKHTLIFVFKGFHLVVLTLVFDVINYRIFISTTA